MLEQGENSAAAQELAAKISALNSDLQANKTKMNEADSAAERLTESMDDVGSETASASDGFTVMRGALSGLIANGISAGISKIGEFATSIFNLAEETREYRSMLAKVEGSANSFGYSIDYAKEHFKEFYSYLNDDQMATNAITNLMGLQVETATLDGLAEGAIATWTAYGDSIPIESLTESITETVNVSKVTGTLADTLNWASISSAQWANVLGNGSAAQKAFNAAIAEGLPVEDAFNAALAATADKQERANMVAAVLNETYGESKATYDELSGSMIEASKAEAELKETQAELAKSIEPINTEFTRLKNKALKTLSPAIQDVADDFSGLINDIDWSGASKTISGMLEGAASGLSFLLRNIEPIATAVKAAAAAWLTYKTAQLAANVATKAATAVMTATTAITGAATAGTVAHTAATKAATIATKALAIAQKMTPWGLVAGLVAAAAVGIGALIAKTKESTKETNANTEATKKITQSYKEYNDALKQNKQTREDNLTSAAAEVESAGILLSSLEKLIGVENKSSAEKAQIAEYVKQLNELIPELNLQYDAEADKLNKSTTAVRNNIQAQKELTLAKAAQAQLQDIAEDMVKTELELADATAQHKKNQEELAAATERADEARRKYQGRAGTTKEYREAIAAEKEAQENYDKTAKTVKKLEGNLESLDEEYANTESYAQARLTSAELEKSLTNLVDQAEAAGVEVPKAVSNGISKGKYALPSSVEEMKSLITYDSLVKQAQESGINIPKSISNGIKTGELQPSQAVTQMNNLITFNDLMNKSTVAGTKVPQNISNAVLSGAMSPQQAVQYMKDLVTYEDMLAKAKKAGVDVPKNIKSGVDSGKLQPSEAVKQINSLMVSEANKPKGEMRKAGSGSASNLASGVSSGSGSVRSAAASVASSGLQGARSQNNGFYGAGGDMARGIERGTRSRDSSIFGTLRSLASSMLSAFKNAINSHSPSKVFIDAARAIPQGIAGGIEKDGSLAVKAVKSLGGEIAKESENLSATMGLDSVRNSISGSLSKIRNRVSTAAAGMTPAVAGVNNITFNQYNTSPKAMDSLEVYRNTQRQLRQFKTWQGGN